MKLTQKIIGAVHYSHRSKPAKELVSRFTLQAAVVKASGLTSKEFAELKRLHMKFPGLGLLRELRFTPDCRVYDNGYRSLVATEGSGSVYYFCNTSLEEVLPQKPSIKNWTVVLSAFSTVEEAIEAYPELKPAFEELFGRAL